MAGERGQWIKVSTAKPGDLSSAQGTEKMEGKTPQAHTCMNIY